MCNLYPLNFIACLGRLSPLYYTLYKEQFAMFSYSTFIHLFVLILHLEI